MLVVRPIADVMHADFQYSIALRAPQNAATQRACEEIGKQREDVEVHKSVAVLAAHFLQRRPDRVDAGHNCERSERQFQRSVVNFVGVFAAEPAAN